MCCTNTSNQEKVEDAINLSHQCNTCRHNKFVSQSFMGIKEFLIDGPKKEKDFFVCMFFVAWLFKNPGFNQDLNYGSSGQWPNIMPFKLLSVFVIAPVQKYLKQTLYVVAYR